MSLGASACALCDSYESRLVLEGRDQRFSMPGSFRVVRCAGCGLIFQDPLPNLKETEFFCEATQDGGSPSRLYQWYSNIVNSRRVQLLSSIMQPGKLLDIGCGEGTFLEQAKKRKWEVNGTELSANACQSTSERLRQNIYRGDLTELGLPEQSLDVVTLWHVLEHIPTPNQLLQEIVRILAPEGILVVEVPNISNPVFALFGKYYFHLDLPRHVFFYNRSTLGGLLEKHGLRVIREDMPSWNYPESIIKSTSYLLSSSKPHKTFLYKASEIVLYAASLLGTGGYLAATKIGAPSEVVRLVARKASRDHGSA